MTRSLYDGPIVDAHQHFWDPGKDGHPWLQPSVNIPFRYGDYSAIKRRYFPEDYAADSAAHRIVETVYVETEWRPTDPIGETRFVHDLAARGKWPNAVVAQAWLHQDDAASVLAAQAAFPLVRSVRHKPGGPSRPGSTDGSRSLMSDEDWRRGYAELARHGLHFDLQTPWWNLHEAGTLARDFPRTTIILNHAGLPTDRSAEGLEGWRDAMAAFAKHPNVAVKVSGLGVLGQAWTVEGNEPVVREILRLFGDERVMFASNFPVDSLCASFDQIFSGFKQMVSDLAPDRQERLFYSNARRIYRTERRQQNGDSWDA